MQDRLTARVGFAKRLLTPLDAPPAGGAQSLEVALSSALT